MNIKLIIFDLDGVLCDAREWHYQSLNNALREIDEKYVISREDHLAKFDGLPTRKKLQLLTEERSLPTEEHDRVWKRKQDKTIDVINKLLGINLPVKNLMVALKDKKYKIGVASNSISATVYAALEAMKILEHVDFVYSNQDVSRPKPSTEMYLRLMLDADCDPHETVILEDSHVGRIAALNSGAHLLPIRTPNEVNENIVFDFLRKLESKPKRVPKWQGGKMNVVIPIAGAGTSFKEAGYTFPKPLIDVNGKPMIQWVVENLNIDANFIFLIREEDNKNYHMEQMLKVIVPSCKVIPIPPYPTLTTMVAGEHRTGAAITTLYAEKYIDNDQPLLIANGDQYVEWDSNEFMYVMSSDNIDGGIATFESIHPKWSFVDLDEFGFVREVAEKVPISNIATCGIYYWSRGDSYLQNVYETINKEVYFGHKYSTNGEYYIAPVYNTAIRKGAKIKTYGVNKMWGLGTPEDVRTFTNNYKEILV